MTQINYRDLSVLVADDFSNFRSTVNSMLLDLGVEDVDTASNGEEVIEKCTRKTYSVILCDYDLGAGRNGQHVLEELRFRKSIGVLSVFIIVSAESSRNIVMSAYDCEPDDYLMKPITGLMLQRRMQRVLNQKEALRPVYRAVANHDFDQATDLLIDMSLADDRHSVAAQKMLGELFIEQGELLKAEKLYSRALEARQVEWARLGLARTKHLLGDLETAGLWLERIVEENPLYLPAYDVLADNWNTRGDKHKVQGTVARAVEVSPMSILRQQRLAKVASENNDTLTAIDALRRAVKLGRRSCYGSVQDNFDFARVVSAAIEKDLQLPPGAAQEALAMVSAASEDFQLSQAEAAQQRLLRGRVQANTGDIYAARESIMSVQSMVDTGSAGIDAELDQVALLLAMGETEAAENLLQMLQKKYADNQQALEKLDKFLSEPASESNREMVAKVNRDGIDLYSVGEYDRAIACFNKARILFPKHVGIHLNIIQALIGKMKEGAAGAELERLHEECHSGLILVESLIDKDNAQYERLLRLKRKADVFVKRSA